VFSSVKNGLYPGKHNYFLSFAILQQNSLTLALYLAVMPLRFLEASSTAIASWSAHEVFLSPQVLPSSFSAICCAVQPSTSLGIALRLPLQPPVKTIFVMTQSASMSKEIILEHVFFALYVYLIIQPPISFAAFYVFLIKMYTISFDFSTHLFVMIPHCPDDR